MNWIVVKRKEQRAMRPPEVERKKVVPVNSPCEIRKVGDTAWQTHYLRKQLDYDDLRCTIDGYLTATKDGYEMRVHRKNVIDEADLTPSPKAVRYRRRGYWEYA